MRKRQRHLSWLSITGREFVHERPMRVDPRNRPPETRHDVVSTTSVVIGFGLGSGRDGMATVRLRRPSFKAPDVSVDHLVIGGGVVGLAIAARFAKAFCGRSTFLLERHRQPGQETSSRNSEVIHAGIYYPADSLRTKLCLRGRPMMYDFCRQAGVPFRQCGKLIVSTSAAQNDQLKKLHANAASLRPAVPLHLLSGAEVRRMEPDVHPDCELGLYSPESGIVDSHGLMAALEESFTAADAGELVYGANVVRIDRSESALGRGAGSEGWVVQTASHGSSETSSIQARVVVNSAGLSAHHILNQVLPPGEARPLHYAKGSYWKYQGPGVGNVSRLIYPAPTPDLAGLGTHLTLSLNGDIRFGPDVEWLRPPSEAFGPDGEVLDPDWWKTQLAPPEDRLESVSKAVASFLPGVRSTGFGTDYSGIRPKLLPEGQGPSDFDISIPVDGFVNLMGIESPGLTASLAIAEMVEGMVRKSVWGLGRGSGSRISETGGPSLDAWA